ncbi:MAG: dicarboxylate/amino acid:cation symporter [Lachnospiraceae bacterium]|nr:dicarboxylate/amino acid:cation symporter [Lachnospiraceae bacterium]
MKKSDDLNINKSDIAKNYLFLGILIAAMILGCVFGAMNPDAARKINFLGTIFINMMFCIVVPLVFASIAGAVAGMKNRTRAGKIIGYTIATFVITGIIAAIIMFVLMKAYPPVLKAWENVPSEELGEYATIPQMITNFLTTSDFTGLLTRRAMLPLIVFSLIFGFATNLIEGGEGPVTNFILGLSKVMVKFVNIVTYYAPVAFFAIFANLMADYGHMITEAYARAMIVYYPLCFIYLFTAFPLFAWFGGGKGAAKLMFSKLARPAIVSLGTCSSVATIPTNLNVAEETGISKDVSNIVIPLGATMHMDGSCFSCVLKIAFVLGVFGQQLSWNQLIPITLLAVFSSVGMSGVPGGGYIGEYIICSVFFPTRMELAFPILVAIGNLVDPPATMINASGDYVVSFIVSRFVDGKDWLQKKLK